MLWLYVHRKFIAEELPKLKESWPAVEIGVALKNGHHPFVVGEYGEMLFNAPFPYCNIRLSSHFPPFYVFIETVVGTISGISVALPSAFLRVLK